MGVKKKVKANAAVTVSGLEVRREGGKIWSPVRRKWLIETPEEKVRQEYLCVLVNEYGYNLDQIGEELEVTGRGSAHARADYVIWRSPQDRADGKSPLVIVECKSDNVTIKPGDYYQGDNYARLTSARFLITHNTRETKYWRVVHEKMPKNMEEIENVPHADATDEDIRKLLERLKVFKEDEFADLLHQCHNVIRNREHKDPAAAFDEIAKLLFVKVDIERRLREKRASKNLFTAEFLDEQAQFHDDPVNVLFRQTKADYRADRIFADDETINLKFNTAREIVKLLERYNLSDTSEDIKGIAFERFLGRTFRGEIGQFFTPRTIVEFMIRMVDPREGSVICDPASGSGGFLIRFFEIVREQILADVDREYQEYKRAIERKRISLDAKAELLRAKYEELQASLDHTKRESRLWNLANRCIFGTDANERMARTSKMNMIMHGDGHGGVHHRNGFLNVNGIFEGRFDIILTNPPFGSSVEPSDVILQSDIITNDEDERRYRREYGNLYTEAQARLKAAVGGPIASLFELPKARNSRVKTEVLFVERCLALLKPGGKFGIVLPEGIFNNPSLSVVREFAEDRAFIEAVISLPPETFLSAGASVKASLLFMRKFTDEEKTEFDRIKADAIREVEEKHGNEVQARMGQFEAEIANAKETRDSERVRALRKELADYTKQVKALHDAEARALLKERFSYLVYLYEAERVGITPTGEPDANELYPNENVPPGVGKTCLELYQELKDNTDALPRKEGEK